MSSVSAEEMPDFNWSECNCQTNDTQIRLWKVPGWESEGFVAIFTTRRGGVSRGSYRGLNLSLDTGDRPSRVKMNRRLLADCLPGEADWKIQTVRQVHGNRILRIDDVAGHKEGVNWWRGPEADGMVTARPGIMAAMQYADCLPVYLVDPQNGVAGLVHAGWRSMTGGIIEKTLTEMQTHHGTSAPGCWVALGPCIERTAFEVDVSVLNAFRAWVPWWREVFYLSRRGHLYLDLRAAARRKLSEIGVKEDCIIAHPRGTYFCEEFYSYRRDASPTGRCMAFLGRQVPLAYR